jgi:hypothetical protein
MHAPASPKMQISELHKSHRRYFISVSGKRPRHDMRIIDRR